MGPALQRHAQRSSAGSLPARSSRQLCVQPRAAVTFGPLKNVFKSSQNGVPVHDAAYTQKVINEEKQYVLQTYARAPVVISHGKGAKMWDVEGKEYIDMAAGIAVNALGHSDASWYAALAEQAQKLAHTSNLYHTQPQVELAKRLVDNSFADKVFFCNTGTEANEGAIKFARKWARVQAGVDPYDGSAEAPYELVSFTSCFHGRTMGALALTYKEQYKTPFFPMMPGHQLAEYNNLESARAVIKKGKTAAVFVEPVQGEGGVTPSTAAFLKGLRELCDEAGCLLVFDEVQCGLGRTGAEGQGHAQGREGREGLGRGIEEERVWSGSAKGMTRGPMARATSRRACGVTGSRQEVGVAWGVASAGDGRHRKKAATGRKGQRVTVETLCVDAQAPSSVT